MEIKVAIIGAGNMAEEHIKVFSSLGNFSVKGIYNRTFKKADSLALNYDIPIVAKSISALYEKTKADILLVAVSELSVFSVLKEAFKYPWVSIVEKPLGYNYENALKIKKLANKNKSDVFVSLNRRFYSSTRYVLEDIKKIEGQRLIQVYDQEEPDLLNRPQKVKRNWMYANSIHVVDYLSLFGRGEILSVQPIVNWNPDISSFVIAKIEYSSGDLGIYSAIWNAPGPWGVSVSTNEKRFELRPLEFASVQSKGSREIKSLPVHKWDKEFKPGLRFQAEEIQKKIEGASHNLVSLNESLKTMELIKKIYEI